MTRLASYVQFPLSHLLLSRSELPPSDPRLPVSAHHHTALDILPPSEMSSVSSYSLAEFFLCSLGPGLNVTFFFSPREVFSNSCIRGRFLWSPSASHG